MEFSLLTSSFFSHLERIFKTGEFERGDSVRLFHGRGQVISDLNWIVIDWFSPVIVITLFKQQEKEYVNQIIEYLLKLFSDSKVDLTCVIIQSRFLQKSPYEVLYGVLPDVVYAKRKNLKFKLSFQQQNLGFFLDIEPARRWLEKNCDGKRVLNLFSYTCVFSVVAMDAGSAGVVNIDLSRKSLGIGNENHKINNLDTNTVKFFPHDIFKSWGKLKKFGPYDIIIIDPPSYQKGSFIASEDYQKVLRRMASLIDGQGYVLACLNSPEVTLNRFCEECNSHLNEFELTSVLPLSEFFPEKEDGRGLKMLVYQKV